MINCFVISMQIVKYRVHLWFQLLHFAQCMKHLFYFETSEIFDTIFLIFYSNYLIFKHNYQLNLFKKNSKDKLSGMKEVLLMQIFHLRDFSVKAPKPKRIFFKIYCLICLNLNHYLFQKKFRCKSIPRIISDVTWKWITSNQSFSYPMLHPTIWLQH